MNKKSNIDFHAAVENAIAGAPTQNVYLLIDQAGVSNVSRELRKHSLQRATLFDDAKEKSAVSVAPVLVLVGIDGKIMATKRLFHWLAEYASDTSSVILMVSPLPLDVMRVRLSARLDVRLSEGMAALLRFYDPRVFEALINVLDNADAKRFLCVASGWMYPNRLGQLELLKTYFQTNDDFSPPLTLSSEQEFALLEASEIDQVMDLLRTIVPSKMAGLSGSERYCLVSDLMTRAQLEGVRSVLAYSIFVGVLLKSGHEVADSPIWSGFINELRKDVPDIKVLSNLIDDLSSEAT